MKKVKSSFYLPADIVQEMKIEAVNQGLRYPSDFILWLFAYRKEREGRNKNGNRKTKN